MSEISKHNRRVLATITHYKDVFSTPSGQKVLNHLMDTFMMRTSHVEKDPYSTAFNEGSRNVVLFILQKLKMNPEQIKEILASEMEDEDDVRDSI